MPERRALPPGRARLDVWQTLHSSHAASEGQFAQDYFLTQEEKAHSAPDSGSTGVELRSSVVRICPKRVSRARTSRVVEAAARTDWIRRKESGTGIVFAVDYTP